MRARHLDYYKRSRGIPLILILLSLWYPPWKDQLMRASKIKQLVLECRCERGSVCPMGSLLAEWPRLWIPARRPRLWIPRQCTLTYFWWSWLGWWQIDLSLIAWSWLRSKIFLSCSASLSSVSSVVCRVGTNHGSKKKEFLIHHHHHLPSTLTFTLIFRHPFGARHLHTYPRTGSLYPYQGVPSWWKQQFKKDTGELNDDFRHSHHPCVVLYASNSSFGSQWWYWYSSSPLAWWLGIWRNIGAQIEVWRIGLRFQRA